LRSKGKYVFEEYSTARNIPKSGAAPGNALVFAVCKRRFAPRGWIFAQRNRPDGAMHCTHAQGYVNGGIMSVTGCRIY
jgi:hypothetical protein